MSIAKELRFDVFLPRLKAQSQQKVFDVLAHETAYHSQTDESTLREVFDRRLSERTFGMGDGIAIFDVKSTKIKRPVMVMGTFEHELDFDSLDGRPVDIMVAVISPYTDGPRHLQKLASISRVMKSRDLCTALREARNIDQMEVLFMPSQDWMIAA